MAVYLPLIWFLMAGAIPLALLIITVFNLKHKVKIGEIFIKILAASILYVSITIFCGIYVASLINSIEDTKGITVGGVRLVPMLDLTSYLLIFGYGIFGFFLCWFVTKDLSKTLSIITRSKQSTQSLFVEK